MSSLDLSQIPLSDLIIAMQYQVNKDIDSAENVVRVLTETFPNKAHVSKVVKEFQEQVDWLTDIKDALDLAIIEANQRFQKQFKERNALLIEAFKKDEYVTPAKQPRQQAQGPKKGPNKPCQHCGVNLRPENHTDHESACRRNPANEGRKPGRRKDPTKPCSYCKKPIRVQNHKRHENACPKNPAVKKRLKSEAKAAPSIAVRIRDAKKKKAKKKTKSLNTPSPHLPSQQSAFDKKHKAGVRKSKVKHARYLCENCGNAEMLIYNGKDTIECPKCGTDAFNVVGRYNDKGERIEDLQIEDQADAYEKG